MTLRTLDRASSLLRHIATLGPIGHIPFAPGTFGTAAGFLILLLVRPPLLPLMAITLLIFVVGIISSHFAEIHFKKKDPGQVVIDELAGYFASMMFLDMNVVNLILAFLLFRCFDILKPPPIRSAETLFKGGLGVMMDDLLAGVYAYISVVLCTKILNLF